METSEVTFTLTLKKVEILSMGQMDVFHSQFAAQVEEMSAEANKERKLRARSDQVR